MPPLQCLFCNHLNPANASFCNGCGSQLNLQPCAQCDAVDNRTATNCYKCGARFDPPGAPELRSTPALSANPALNYADFSKRNLPPHHASAELQPVYQLASDKGAAAPSSQRRWRTALATFTLAVIAVMAVSSYLYFKPTVPFTKPLVMKQAAPRVLVEPTPATPPALAVAPQAEVAQAPPVTAPKREAISPSLGKAVSFARPGTDAASARTQQPPAVLKECPQAVAALGLC